VFDSRLDTPDWVQLEYDCTGDATGRLLFYVRTGNTPLPELGGWNSWVNIATATAGGFATITSSDLRYCQYKVIFQRNSNGPMPVLNEVRLICGGLSIEAITTDTPDGVCQGQTGIPVGVTLKNTYINPVSLTNATLSFSLGSYTFTLVSPTLPVTINPGVATAATFTVSVADASPVGMAVIQALATGTSGPSTFFDRDAQIPGSWLVRKKATMVIKEVRTVPTAVNKGQNGIPVFIDLENTGETPLVFNGASLTFSLGFYTQTLISPALGTVIPGPGSLTVQISVNVLSNSPSGISTIDATASGTNAFSGKPANAAGAVVKDAWTIQSPSDLVLVSITASSTVYRGQTGIPVFLNVQNIKEAPASWTSSTLLPYFTLGTYDAVYPVTPFPVTVLGGQSLTVQYGVDISPLSATGTSSVDARIDWLDGNMGDAKFYERALLPATWTIMAEVVKSYKDAAGLYPSTSFNRPSVGSTMIYAKGENLAPFKDFVVRWYDPSGTEVASSNPPLTALASGTLAHQYAIGPTSPFGQWTIRVTNPLNTIVSCQTSFDVVNGASLTASLSLPLTVSVGQPFQAVMSCSNVGGARIRDAYPGVLASSGTGIATLTAGPTPDSQDILGYTSATFTWMWRATSAGTFVASDVAFGVDANADLAIRSATATSNVCVIQTPPSLSLISLTATPTLVYRNQKNIEVEARVRNSGQATAMLTTASLSFTLGSYTQAIATPSVLPASIPGNNAVATITFMVDVDFDSPEGLATLTFGMRAYDANVPASVTILVPASPNDRWTIGSIGIQLSRETDFSTEQYAFNRGQDVKIRAFGLPPYSTGYRFRLYSSTIPNTSPAPAGWTDVSNRLTATSKGWVDYVYTLPAGAALTRWSVEIETDPDSNSTTRDQLLAVNYFDVQTPGNLIASLTISPNPVFVDDTVTVTLVASNTTPSGASVSPATPSALVPTAASTGAMSYQTGPAPASSTVTALASTTFVWTYKATDDTGTVGSYSLTAQLACSVYGVDANTGTPINSQAAVSNGLKIYRRAMALSPSAFDLGSLAPGETTSTIPFQVGNVGNLVLSAVKWNKVDLNGVFPLTTSHAYVTLAPSPIGAINPDASAAVSIAMTVPYNQASGTYATTMSVYEDMNGNGNPDSIEPYKIFTVTVNVLSRPKVFVIENLIDLGNWSPGQTTNAKSVNLFNGGNQAVTNVKFVQTIGSATFLAVSPNPGNLTIGESRVASVSAAIPAAATQGIYVATWTMWADTDADGAIDAGEASDTFQVRVGVGTKQFTLSPPVLPAGLGTPSTIISGLKETITNTGSLSLTNLKASLQALQDGMGNSIATDNISIIPPASVVTTGTATVALFVPPGMIMGAYSGVQTLYEDSNGNGVADPGEASGTFTLTVSIPAYPAVQVLAPTVELGDLAPGAVVTVPFACRNSGNVTLSRLMWTKLPLVSAGGNTISTPSYDFPPGVPFTAAPGAIFTRDVRLIVNVAQPPGDYTGSSAWLFDDTDLGLDRDTGEPQSPFIIKCRIGSAALDIENLSYATSGPPATYSAETAIKFRNTGSLTITSLVATCSALVGPQTIPASASFIFPVSGSFVPAPLGSILVGGQKFGYWRVLVPANRLPGLYTGTLTAWNDINGDKQLQSYEASDTCAINLTVTSNKAINVLQSNLDLGWTTENSVVSGTIEIVNTGNQDLTMVRAVIATLSSGIDVIPASSIVYLPAVPGGFTVGQSQLATITITVGSPKADGTYVATHRIYDDYNGADGSYNPGNEENDTFTITLRIGHKSVFETDPTNPPVDFGPQDPGGTVVKSFTAYNGSAIPLTKLRWKNLVPLTGTGYTFPLASLTWSPAAPFGIPGSGNISCAATVELASFVPPDVYTGDSAVWEDENGDGVIQAAEATANFQVKLTVNPRPLITLLPGMVDFGRIGRGQASGWVGICYYNAGNVPLNAFSWTFANVGDGAGHTIPAAVIAFDPLFNPDPTPVGSYGTTTVRIGPVDPLQELGVYDQSGPQVISAGGGVVSDDCQFRCEIIQGGPIGLSSGTVYQEIATFTFQPPESRYVLSAYVCPGTGSARISFFDTTEGGAIVFQPWVEIDSDGRVQGSTTGSGEFGVVEAWPAQFGANVYMWYRIYVSFEYYLDTSTASKTYIMLGNTSPVSPPTASHAVWFDGVQLEKPDNQTQKRPTAFAPGKKIVSPYTELDLSGKKYYFEW